MVFTADRAGVVAEEIEVDKDRVVGTVGLYIQRQQGEEPCGLNREARVGGYVSIPNVAKDLSGDRLVMTGAAIEDQRAFGIGCNWSEIGQVGVRLDRDRIVFRLRGRASRHGRPAGRSTASPSNLIGMSVCGVITHPIRYPPAHGAAGMVLVGTPAP